MQPAVVSRIEKGVPGTAVGTVLEAAVVCGVPQGLQVGEPAFDDYGRAGFV